MDPKENDTQGYRRRHREYEWEIRIEQEKL
jgi:hypothetical protein